MYAFVYFAGTACISLGIGLKHSGADGWIAEGLCILFYFPISLGIKLFKKG